MYTVLWQVTISQTTDVIFPVNRLGVHWCLGVSSNTHAEVEQARCGKGLSMHVFLFWTPLLYVRQVIRVMERKILLYNPQETDAGSEDAYFETVR